MITEIRHTFHALKDSTVTGVPRVRASSAWQDVRFIKSVKVRDSIPRGQYALSPSPPGGVFLLLSEQEQRAVLSDEIRG